jgi:hypothetical protein
MTVIAIDLHRPGVKLVRKSDGLHRGIPKAVPLCPGKKICGDEGYGRNKHDYRKTNPQRIVKQRFFHASTLQDTQ